MQRHDKIQIFVSYSHADKDLCEKFLSHLSALSRANIAEFFYDKNMLPGDHIDSTILAKLNESHIAVLLISSDFMASHYCWEIERSYVMERHQQKKIRAAPVIIKDCAWKLKGLGLSDFLLLPEDGKAITDTAHWPSMDTALKNVCEGLARLCQEIPQMLSTAQDFLTENENKYAQKFTDWNVVLKNIDAFLLQADERKKLAACMRRNAARLETLAARATDAAFEQASPSARILGFANAENPKEVLYRRVNEIIQVNLLLSIETEVLPEKLDMSGANPDLVRSAFEFLRDQENQNFPVENQDQKIILNEIIEKLIDVMRNSSI